MAGIFLHHKFNYSKYSIWNTSWIHKCCVRPCLLHPWLVCDCGSLIHIWIFWMRSRAKSQTDSLICILNTILTIIDGTLLSPAGIIRSLCETTFVMWIRKLCCTKMFPFVWQIRQSHHVQCNSIATHISFFWWRICTRFLVTPIWECTVHTWHMHFSWSTRKHTLARSPSTIFCT